MENNVPNTANKVRLSSRVFIHSEVQPACVPRRYDLRTIMIVTAVLACLLTLLKLAGVPPIAIGVIVIFLTLVGIAQAILFGGVRPRRASVLAGMVIVPIVTFSVFIASGSVDRLLSLIQNSAVEAFLVIGGMFFTLISNSLMGALFGYLGGGVVAGVFLIMDLVQEKFGRKTPEVILAEEVALSHGVETGAPLHTGEPGKGQPAPLQEEPTVRRDECT